MSLPAETPSPMGRKPFKVQDVRRTPLIWVLEYYTLILLLVLGSYYGYLKPKSIYLFSRVQSKVGLYRTTAPPPAFLLEQCALQTGLCAK